MLAHANKNVQSINQGMYDNCDSTFIPLKITLYLLKQVNPVDKTGLFEKLLMILKLIIQLKRKVIDEIAEILR